MDLMTESSDRTRPAAFSYPGHGPNARIGIAICHGFTGSPLSILPWAEFLAGRGFAVSVPLLPGHGTELAGPGPRQDGGTGTAPSNRRIWSSPPGPTTATWPACPWAAPSPC